MRSRVDFGATASGLCGREPMQDEQQPDLIGLERRDRKRHCIGASKHWAPTGKRHRSDLFSSISTLDARAIRDRRIVHLSTPGTAISYLRRWAKPTMLNSDQCP